MGLPEFDEEVIRDLATEMSYARGEEYADYGAVRNLVLEGETYRAHVYGTHRYIVRVWDESGDIGSSCTCPYDWGGVCKHIVAVMLSVLEQQERGQAVKAVDQPVTLDAGTALQVDELLAALSHEQLQAFIRLQVDEFPKLIDNLHIFAQGAVESDKTVAAYTAEIAAALADGSFQNPYADEYEYSYYNDDDDDDEYDTVADVLEPYRDAARKYLAQNNWLESAKIQEAIVHACGQLRLGDADDNDDDDDEAYSYDRDDDYVAEAGHTEAQRALQDWAELISRAAEGSDKQRLIERFVAVFAPDDYDLGPQPWEHAFHAAIQTAPDAEAALGCIDALQLKDGDPDKAGVLLHLLGLSGDTDRFLRVGEHAIRHHPHLALPLADKLLAIGQRTEAIKAAETALGHLRDELYHFAYRDTREDLLRFLVKTCDPKRDSRKLLKHAETLLFEYNDPKDYEFLRDLMTTQAQRDTLIRQVQTKCEPETVTKILSSEARWDDLLAYARRHTRVHVFPGMIRRLRDHFPEACFDLYRQVVTDLLESGTGQRLYDSIASHARQMRDIPGQEEAFGQFMAAVIDTYKRRPSLMSTLGELVTIGRAWQEHQRQEGVKNLTLAQAQAMDLDELAHYCPITPEMARQVGGQRGSAALVWAILLQHGGTMDAAEITDAIAEHRNMRPPSASGIRSGGLRLLEALDWVEIDREGNRLRQVRLLKGLE
jgi:hypothetical protein